MLSLSLASRPALEKRLDAGWVGPLARACGFARRCSGKITPAAFVLTSCLFALQATPSLACFAQLWAVLHGQTLSKQAVHKRFTAQAVSFLEAVLKAALFARLETPELSTRRGLPFGRVLVQDSTTLSLPAGLAALFPGPANGRSEKRSALKIQATLDLLKNRWLFFGLSPFICNDQSAAAQILEHLRPADLVIRDLGYLVVGVLARMQEQGAYFLSRWRQDLKILDARSGAPLNLARLFGSVPIWDGEVILAGKGLRVRLIAQRLPESAAAHRRRKARANRDRRLNHSDDYYRLLGWNIFLTNVPPALLKAEPLIGLYRCRWRIETIFKAWKSHFSLGCFTEASAEQILIVILGKLIWICWFSAHWADLADQNCPVSILKLADWWSKFAPWQWLASPPSAQSLSNLLRYYCRYDQRNDRSNFLDQCASLG